MYRFIVHLQNLASSYIPSKQVGSAQAAVHQLIFKGFAAQQHGVVKTGGRLVKHARYHWLLLAEGRLGRRCLAACYNNCGVVPLPDGWLTGRGHRIERSEIIQLGVGVIRRGRLEAKDRPSQSGI